MGKTVNVSGIEALKVKAIIRTLFSLTRNKPPYVYYSINGVSMRTPRKSSYGRINSEDITRLLEPFVEQDLVRKVIVNDAYGRAIMTCYSINHNRIGKLEEHLETI